MLMRGGTIVFVYAIIADFGGGVKDKVFVMFSEVSRLLELLLYFGTGEEINYDNRNTDRNEIVN